MIARFLARIPFTVHTPAGAFDAAKAHELEIAGMAVRFLPPYRTSLTAADLDQDSTVPFMDLAERLVPQEGQSIDPKVLIQQQPSVRCDGLCMEFIKESFDRSSGSDDPSSDLAFSLLNDWLGRLRLLGQVPQVRPLSPQTTLWMFEYLQDDGSTFEPAPPLIRRRMSSTWTFQTVGLTPSLWDSVGALPWGFQVSPAETLLLDAQDALQEVGPAIVLAATALETRISQALDILASAHGVQPGIWRWVNERDFFLKSPSMEEQFDTLLEAVARRSLKEEPRLWQGFKNLRTARKSFRPRRGSNHWQRSGGLAARCFAHRSGARDRRLGRGLIAGGPQTPALYGGDAVSVHPGACRASGHCARRRVGRGARCSGNRRVFGSERFGRGDDYLT